MQQFPQLQFNDEEQISLQFHLLLQRPHLIVVLLVVQLEHFKEIIKQTKAKLNTNKGYVKKSQLEEAWELKRQRN